METLFLCRSDNMGVRYMVPAVNLRLGKDQECYDFCRWWAIVPGKPRYNVSDDLDQPYLDFHDCDAFEPVQGLFVRDWASLSHTIAIALLKIRLFQTLRAVRYSSLLAVKVPEDILDCIRDHITQGTIIAHRKDIYQNTGPAAMVSLLQEQIRELFTAVTLHNKYFWPALLDPGRHLKARPEHHCHGAVEEMQFVLQHSYNAWIETQGALEIVRELSSGATF